MDDIQKADVVRSMIRHENDLFNQRIIWMTSIQGFLLAAAGFSWSKPDTRELILVICVVGLITSVSLMRAIYAGDSAIKGLILWWDKNKSPDYAGPDVIGVRSDSLGFLYPWITLPPLFLVAWILVITIRFVFVSFPSRTTL